MSKTLRNVITILVIAGIFALLLRNMILNWTKIPFEELHFNVPLILFSFGMLIIHFASYSRSWQVIMGRLGMPMTLSQSAWMIATTQVGKYIPGKIWYMVGRVYVGKQARMDGKILAISMVLETCLLMITGTIIFLTATMITGDGNPGMVILSAVLGIVAITFLHPRVLIRASNILLRVLRKPEVAITLTYPQILHVSIYFFGLWIAQIIGFALLVRAIYPVPFSGVFNLASAYTLSWIGGFIALFAPGGLGVREGMMTLLLSPILPLPLAIAVSLIARVWITVFEAIVFFIGLAIQRRARDKNQFLTAP